MWLITEEKTCLDCKWCEINEDKIPVCTFLRKHGINLLPIFISQKFNSSDTTRLKYLASSCQTFEDKEENKI